jgi:hypothetical protein
MMDFFCLQDTFVEQPLEVSREPRKGLPRIESTDFANDELLQRNAIFCGRV